MSAAYPARDRKKKLLIMVALTRYTIAAGVVQGGEKSASLFTVLSECCGGGIESE